MRYEHAEVRDAEPLGLEDRHRVGRGRRLEPDTEENHLSIRVFPGELERIEW